MINTMALLIDSWYDLLNNQLTYSGKSVKVYLEDAPEQMVPTASLSEHYVIIRAEGETDQSSKQYFANDSVVIVDIVTRFKNNVNRSVVDNIDGQIGALILTTPHSNGLGTQTGIQILNVQRETSTYLYEADNIEKYYRKVSRYISRILTT